MTKFINKFTMNLFKFKPHFLYAYTRNAYYITAMPYCILFNEFLEFSLRKAKQFLRIGFIKAMLS